MKTRALICLAAMILLATLAVSSQLTGQDTPGPSHYRVIDLGTLGGTLSTGNAINNIGWVMGNSDEAGNNVQLATLWLYGLQIPLGTLGGPSSNIPYNVKNNFRADFRSIGKRQARSLERVVFLPGFRPG